MAGELSRLNDRTIMAQYGPISLTIQAWDPSGPDLALAARAGEYSFGILPRIARARDLFRGKGVPLPDDLQRPFREPVLENMCTAVEAVAQPGLGPMAAVAGAVADEVAQWLYRAGAVKAIVENGGDIALYLAPDQRAAVGVRTSLKDPYPRKCLEISGQLSAWWGIATSSGTGGRGLNRGLAEAAVCVAAGTGAGALADAAATAVSNSCFVESEAVQAVPAECLDPETDIPGILVTAAIGDLTPEEIDAALDNSRGFAQSLVDREVILGSYIFFRGKDRLTAGFAEVAAPLVDL
ncbi:MAG: hypothetical protein LBP33_04885 [Candidatus Adiutrix sp.]|nr:hypothetical protein [Candidatus Adiutrix sp.]